MIGVEGNSINVTKNIIFQFFKEKASIASFNDITITPVHVEEIRVNC